MTSRSFRSASSTCCCPTTRGWSYTRGRSATSSCWCWRTSRASLYGCRLVCPTTARARCWSRRMRSTTSTYLRRGSHAWCGCPERCSAQVELRGGNALELGRHVGLALLDARLDGLRADLHVVADVDLLLQLGDLRTAHEREDRGEEEQDHGHGHQAERGRRPGAHEAAVQGSESRRSREQEQPEGLDRQIGHPSERPAQDAGTLRLGLGLGDGLVLPAHRERLHGVHEGRDLALQILRLAHVGSFGLLGMRLVGGTGPAWGARR